MHRIASFLALFAVVFSDPASAAEPLAAQIDREIAKAWAKGGPAISPRSSDAEFLRRVSLDLTGRLPSAADTRAFLQDSAKDKRTQLIDRLLASPAFARHLQETFDVLFMDRRRDVKVPRADWEEFLRKSFLDNKPYDQLVREILSNDGTDPKTRPAAKFLLDRDLDPTLVTRDISRLFLGRNLQCAQCHDHPLVSDYKQAHYYGIQAFFNRAFLFPNVQAATAVIAEKAEGEANFTSVFDPKKVQMTTAPKVLEWKPIADPKLEKGKEYKVAPTKDVKPVPNYSRFSQLGTAITASENAAFARTAANRLWAMMLGRGLVHPLDYDHSDNPASHPELLDLLTRELAAHKFDVKWFLGQIAKSETYQRSSERPANSDDPEPSEYRTAQLKPLTAEQLGYAMVQASGVADTHRNALPKTATEADLHAKVAPEAQPFIKAFAGRPGEVETEFRSTLDQTLFVKHGAAMRTLIAVRPGNLLDRTMKLNDSRAIADELYLAIFTRQPSAEERQDIVDLLQSASDRKALLADTIWAFLASAEFRFNH